jgi:hypothetical protein
MWPVDQLIEPSSPSRPGTITARLATPWTTHPPRRIRPTASPSNLTSTPLASPVVDRPATPKTTRESPSPPGPYPASRRSPVRLASPFHQLLSPFFASYASSSASRAAAAASSRPAIMASMRIDDVAAADVPAPPPAVVAVVVVDAVELAVGDRPAGSKAVPLPVGVPARCGDEVEPPRPRPDGCCCVMYESGMPPQCRPERSPVRSAAERAPGV